MGLATQPIQVPVWRYLCPFCRRGRSTAKAASAHIARCYKNPAARACKTCHAYQPEEQGDYATGYPGCAEGCHAGRDLRTGLLIGCSDWGPRPRALAHQSPGEGPSQ